MICPRCDIEDKQFVIATREAAKQVIRRRKCKHCETQFETIELIRKPTEVMSDRMLERLVFAGVIIHD